jgi:hypothetical protein
LSILSEVWLLSSLRWYVNFVNAPIRQQWWRFKFFPQCGRPLRNRVTRRGHLWGCSAMQGWRTSMEASDGICAPNGYLLQFYADI